MSQAFGIKTNLSTNFVLVADLRMKLNTNGYNYGNNPTTFYHLMVTNSNSSSLEIKFKSIESDQCFYIAPFTTCVFDDLELNNMIYAKLSSGSGDVYLNMW